MKEKRENQYDVIVIGGGPAGMTAAIQASSRGGRVLLLEKNPGLGKKLLITGGGRCNVTNDEENLHTLLGNYKEGAPFLFSTFTQYGVAETRTFFRERGLETKVEPGKRVFPVTDKAESVHAVLLEEIRRQKVTVETNCAVSRILHTDNQVTGIILKDGRTISATSYIHATGGLSRPETGSTGDGFSWLRDLGHTVHKPDASLVPIAVKESWITSLSGVSLDNVKVTVLQNGVSQIRKVGRVLCTHVGLSGPLILNTSKLIGDLLEYGTVTISLDLFSTEDHGTLDDRLIDLFREHSHKQFKNTLPLLLPNSLAGVIVELSEINPEQGCHSITKTERRRLTHLLKALPLTISHLLGTDKAIVTSGGVSLTEINFKTMQSRKLSNLYVTGDLLNIDRPSGGFSLQLCWSTGYVAGNSVPL